MKHKAVKIIAAVLGISTVIASTAKAFASEVHAAADTVTINVYNWGQYISDGSDGYPDVIADFEEAYPYISVNYMTFDSNESLYSKLTTGGVSYDVIIPSDYMITTLIDAGLLQKLDYSNIPNYEYVDDEFKNMSYDPNNEYTVPYTWGTVGLIYNTKYINEEDVTSWTALWNTDYAGKILMFDNNRDAFALAELALGYSINTEDPDELKKATDYLIEQKPLVQSYVMDQIYDKMERGEAWIAPYYAGDYLMMVEENEDLAFTFPEEGFNLFVDAMCIPTCAEHKKEAEIFINYMTDPEVSGPNLEYLFYSTPISAAKEYMDEELVSNEIAYPGEEILSNGEVFLGLSTETLQLMNELWLSVKTEDEELTYYTAATCAAIVILILLWVFFKVRKRQRRLHRCGR